MLTLKDFDWCGYLSRNQLWVDFSSLDNSSVEYEHEEFVMYLNLFPDKAYDDVITAYLNNFVAIIENDHPIYIYKQVIDGEVNFNVMVREDLKKIFENRLVVRTITKDGKQKKVTEQILDLWLKHPYRRRYKKIDFMPGLSRKNSEIFNLYRGSPYPKGSPEVINANIEDAFPWLDCVRDVWCSGNEHLFQYTSKLLAYFFQFPQIQPGICICLQGSQGSGKSSVVHVFSDLFAPHFKIADKTRAFGRFNYSVMKDALLVFLDETALTSKEQIDQFKSYITEPTVPVEDKGKSSITVRNYSRWIVASNREDIIKLELNNRRFFVLRTADTFAGRPGDPKVQEYFYKVRNVPRAALAKYLYNVDLSDFKKDNIPITDVAEELKFKNFSPLYKFWIYAAKENEIGYDTYWNDKSDVFSENKFNRFDHTLYMKKDMVHGAFKDWTEKNCAKASDLGKEEFWKQTYKLLDKENYKEGRDGSDRIVKFINYDAIKENLKKATKIDTLFDVPFDFYKPPKMTQIVLDTVLCEDFIREPKEFYFQLLSAVREDFEPQDNLMFRINNKLITLPRRKAFYADYFPDGHTYLYRYGNFDSNGKPFHPRPKPWNPVVEGLRHVIYKRLNVKCTHCVVNLYRNGNDHIGLHQDKIQDIDVRSDIYSYSFGATRKLLLEPLDPKKYKSVVIDLPPGSLLILGWETNTLYKHSILKDPTITEPRLSFTFRKITTTHKSELLGVHV